MREREREREREDPSRVSWRRKSTPLLGLIQNHNLSLSIH
jgi:hypothetical protein